MTWSKNLWPDGRCDHLANHIRVDLAGAPPGSNSYCTAVELPAEHPRGLLGCDSLDDRNGRLATGFSTTSSPTGSGSCKFDPLLKIVAVPPARSYKANVGGSSPSAPTN